MQKSRLPMVSCLHSDDLIWYNLNRENRENDHVEKRNTGFKEHS